MTLLLKPTSEARMDPSGFLRYTPEALAGLLPEPPSQAPPSGTRGPSIMTSNEVNEFNIQIEALTGDYTHTANWKDPPRAIQRAGHRTTLFPQSDFGDQFMIPHYHGVWNNAAATLTPQGTIAPQELLQNGLSGDDGFAYNTPENAFYLPTSTNISTMMDAQRQFLGDMIPDMNGVGLGNHAVNRAPNPFGGLDINDLQLAASFPSPANLPSRDNVAIYRSSSSTSQPSLQYGTDMAYASKHFTAQEEMHTTQRSFAYYGLELQPSAGNTRLNSPEVEEPGIPSRGHRKRKSELIDDMSTDFATSHEASDRAKRQRNSKSLAITSGNSNLKDDEPIPISPGNASFRNPNRPRATATTNKRGRKRGTSRTNLTKDERMANHRTSEQNRRNRTKKAKSRLWVLVPALKQKKKWAEKSQLDEAIKQIQEVIAGNGSLKQQLARLRRG